MILPKPAEAFEWLQAAGGPALVCRPLAEVARHLFTTRPWSLGLRRDGTTGDEWRDVAGAMGVDESDLIRVRQVHGVVVSVGRPEPGAAREADVLLVNDPALAVAVQAADCVPLLMADRLGRAVAAIHAGWRGLAAGAPAVGLAALEHEYGIRPADVIVAIGPSVGPCCYEVGHDVRTQFDDRAAEWFFEAPQPSMMNPSMSRVSRLPRRDRAFFDLGGAARAQLASAGVPAAQIFSCDLCTASHPDWLCSYRRDGAAAGRMAGAIRLGRG